MNSATVARYLKMETSSEACLTLAEAIGAGADPAVAALGAVDASMVKSVASAAVKSGLTVAAVGQIGDVRI